MRRCRLQIADAGVTRFEIVNESNNFGMSPSWLSEMLEVHQHRTRAAFADEGVACGARGSGMPSPYSDKFVIS